MKPKERPRDDGPDADSVIERIADAAIAHGDANGNLEYGIGDLEIVLQAAWARLTPEQRRAVLRDESVVSVFEAPEFEKLAAELRVPIEV